MSEDYDFSEIAFMSPEDMYGDEWAKICEAEDAAHKEMLKLKQKYKQRLKKLCNVERIWEWLNDHDSWEPLGVFDVRIQDKYNSYYSKIKPHATIQHSEFKHLDLHHQFESKSEVGTNHYFIQQWTHGEDSYSGYIAFPLKNYKYFLISYSC